MLNTIYDIPTAIGASFTGLDIRATRAAQIVKTVVTAEMDLEIVNSYINGYRSIGAETVAIYARSVAMTALNVMTARRGVTLNDFTMYIDSETGCAIRDYTFIVSGVWHTARISHDVSARCWSVEIDMNVIDDCDSITEARRLLVAFMRLWKKTC